MRRKLAHRAHEGIRIGNGVELSEIGCQRVEAGGLDPGLVHIAGIEVRQLAVIGLAVRMVRQPPEIVIQTFVDVELQRTAGAPAGHVGRSLHPGDPAAHCETVEVILRPDAAVEVLGHDARISGRRGRLRMGLAARIGDQASPEQNGC